MTTAAVLLAAGAGTRFVGPTHKLLAPWGATTVIGAALAGALDAGFDEVIVVSGAVDLDRLADAEGSPPVTVVHNDRWAEGQATSLRRGVDVADEHGHDAVVVGLADQPGVGAGAWRSVAASEGPLVAARFGDERRPPVRLARSVWDLLPVDADEGARGLMRDHPELVTEVVVVGDPRDIDEPADLCNDDDRAYVEQCLGRAPRCAFDVAARDATGRPTVIRNPPFLDDGTPMPTRYWLIDPTLNRLIGGVESRGGVDEAEAEIGLDRVAEAHARYAAERDALIDPDRTGPRPSGGVAGTRIGVKCLHAHYAWFLAGGNDPVGAWVQSRLDEETS